MTFSCRLLTPERTLFEQELASISLPTTQGEITILTHHVALTVVLVPGIVRFTTTSGDEQEVAVSQGLIQVAEHGRVTVLAHTAERGEELDLTAIETARQRAEAVMREAIGKDDVSFAMAAAALQRELARERLVKRRTHHSSSNPPTA